MACTGSSYAVWAKERSCNVLDRNVCDASHCAMVISASFHGQRCLLLEGALGTHRTGLTRIVTTVLGNNYAQIEEKEVPRLENRLVW